MPHLMSAPWRAALPTVTTTTTTTTTVGVASTRAQGQAITSTDITRSSCCSVSSPLLRNQTRMQIATTIGANQVANRSARRWVSPLFSCAWRTILVILPSMVAVPICAARTASTPLLLSVPTKAAEPAALVRCREPPARRR